MPMVIYGDLNETFQAGMVYVILSRIVSISQLYLKKFDEDKIYCNEITIKRKYVDINDVVIVCNF